MNAPFPISLGTQIIPTTVRECSGEFIDRGGERFYVIRNAHEMPAFFTCIVSSSDHFLFASSNGSLTAGRKNAEKALFPYATEDKIRDNALNTGPYTAFIVDQGGARRLWEPFRESGAFAYRLERNLYKSVAGDKLGFEEINCDLGLRFYYEWTTSEVYGFVRSCELSNQRGEAVQLALLDGVQNVLPACVDQQMQLGFSCLLDAYKQNEKVGDDGLCVFTLASQIVDRAEPREALRASTAFGLGLLRPTVLLSSEQIPRFLRGHVPQSEALIRGKRGAFFQCASLTLQAGASQSWKVVLDVERTQCQVTSLKNALREPMRLQEQLEDDVRKGGKDLFAIVARTDGVQATGDESATAHHFANTLFNDMRGGVFVDQCRVGRADFIRFVHSRNRVVFERHLSALSELSEKLEHGQLVQDLAALEDPDLVRLGYEYLPLTFSRRHGDPSRPWNKFDIRVRAEDGRKIVGFQGNWRDIFQNWEALSLSFPGFLESIIAKFVNASTADGYNPYRITDAGIDWEVPEPENPWAGIGYWGDHQIIYLLKLLEQSRAHHPERLSALVTQAIYTYANVPYRIKDYLSIKQTPRDTIEFDVALHVAIEKRVEDLGADGKLLFFTEGAQAGELVRVTLAEKLLVTSLAKMANFVPGAGIWLNTQRPEWNDANNALVGSGVSMVTLYYMTRFFLFLDDLFGPLVEKEIEISAKVADWLHGTHRALVEASRTNKAHVDEAERRRLVDALGECSASYRARVYESGLSAKVKVSGKNLIAYVAVCREHLRYSLALGKRDDGLYHAYNLLEFDDRGGLRVEHLYPMLEGQVAVLSAGVLSPAESLEVLESLRASAMFREDQDSFMLYPNRDLPSFLEKNRVSEATGRSCSLFARLEKESSSIISRDADGTLRFGADLFNAEQLENALRRHGASSEIKLSEQDIKQALVVYEETFNHHAFTGRSGTMFGYEGLGSIYWHMVAKLLLAVQENLFWAEERGASRSDVSRLAQRYYEIRRGVGGFNKSPHEYGAFPLDPYSHTPENSGARQPGMTGQVKEEVLTRFGELGVRVREGKISFAPTLLRESEFLHERTRVTFVGLDEREQQIDVNPGCLAFTYCQVPIVYERSPGNNIVVTCRSGEVIHIQGCELHREISESIFERRDLIERIGVSISPGLLS